MTGTTGSEEKRAWLIISNLENWEIAAQNSVFGINNTPGKLRGLKKGDFYCTYITGIGFSGWGEITLPYFVSDRVIWKDKKYRHRFGISPLRSSGKIVPGATLKDDLSFVTSKEKWSVHLRGGMMKIPLEDFNTIRKALEKSVTSSLEIEKRLISEKYTTKDIGDELHDRILKLFTDAGFAILEDNRTKQGPDIVVEDPLTKDNTKIIIQCKNTNLEDNSTFSSLEKMIDEYSRKREKNGAAIAILAISGYKVSKKIDPVSVLENDKVAIWTDDVIDYYETLASKLSGFSKYQILGDLGVHAKFQDDAVFDAIKIHQSKYNYYIAAVTPDWLLKTTTVLRRVNYSGKITGYQRLLNEKRITKDIPNYLSKEKWIFPNAIICTTKPGSGVQLKYSDNKIHLPSKYGIWWVIDGQHRLYAFAHSLARRDPQTQLILTLIDSESFGEASEAEQADIFVSLNQNAKKVQKKLFIELEDVLGIRNPNVQIVFGLAKKAPFKDSVAGYTQKQGSISLVAFSDAVRQVLPKFKQKYGTATEEIIKQGVRDLGDYFSSVVSVFDTEWNDPSYILKTDRGVNGLLALYVKILDRQAAGMKEGVEIILKALKESNMDLKLESRTGQFLGGGGGKKFADDMAIYISKKIPGFEPSFKEQTIDRIKSPAWDDSAATFIKKWLATLEGSVRVQSMFFDKSSFDFLRSLDKSKVTEIKVFFADIPKDEKADVLNQLSIMRDQGYDIVLTRARKPYTEGGFFHMRWVGSDKYCIYTDADLKQNAQRNSGVDIKVTEWHKSPALKEFDDYWSFAEHNPKGVKLDYDWSGED